MRPAGERPARQGWGAPAGSESCVDAREGGCEALTAGARAALWSSRDVAHVEADVLKGHGTNFFGRSLDRAKSSQMRQQFLVPLPDGCASAASGAPPTSGTTASVFRCSLSSRLDQPSYRAMHSNTLSISSWERRKYAAREPGFLPTRTPNTWLRSQFVNTSSSVSSSPM